MKHVSTNGIVLTRTNFGEADRIITFLTSEHGKVRLLARGVRKQKSKLAGGIELFSVSDISYLIGRGDIYTLTSSRLVNHWGNIVKDADRTAAGYEFLKLINKNTEDNPEPEYFELLRAGLAGLDNLELDLELIKLWFAARLLKLAGHSPNLHTDKSGQKLTKDVRYNFDYDSYNFMPAGRGKYAAGHIQLLRLTFSAASPGVLGRVTDAQKLIKPLQGLAGDLSQRLLRQ